MPEEYDGSQRVKRHYKVSKNRLLLLSAVNVASFVCTIFSMLFYEWIWIEFTTSEGTLPT